MWVILKTEGEIRHRAKRAATLAWPLLLVFVILVTVFTFTIQPQVPARFNGTPFAYFLPLAAAAGILGSRRFMAQGKELPAFLGSVVFLLGMLLSVVFGLYPMVLPAAGDPESSLTIYNAAGPAYSLRVALFWWVPGMILVTAYTTFVYRQMAGKVKLDEEGY
jgi:cytochrome d ubiquinol oxidase subunit II